MTHPFRVSLRAGEKIYINGAVLRVDRKCALELLNDVTFLLENHVLQADQATTPLRQLYFVVQAMLMDPDGQEHKLALFRDFHSAQSQTFESPEILAGLREIGGMVEDGRPYEALRAIRELYPLEETVLADRPGPADQLQLQVRSAKDGNYAA